MIFGDLMFGLNQDSFPVQQKSLLGRSSYWFKVNNHRVCVAYDNRRAWQRISTMAQELCSIAISYGQKVAGMGGEVQEDDLNLLIWVG